MNYQFTESIANLAPSAIREILKYSSVPGMISFAAGNPAPEAFPTEDIARISADILKNDAIGALQYSVTEGYRPLRDRMKEYMKIKHNSVGEDDELIITSGAQQVMDLMAKAFCEKGDTIIAEAPSFIGSLNTFRSYGAHLVGIPVDDDGMNIEALEKALKENPNTKFIYTIPNFQNPTGITMSLEKRKAIYALAKKYNVLVLEDNPYGEIRFSGENIPTIKSLDTDGIVVYAGSFSKVLSPGLRVGYAIGNKKIIAKLTVCKQTSDVHTTIFSQMITDEFLKTTDFEAHLNKLRGIYRHKAQLMMSLMDNYFGDKITYHKVEGGLFIWCTLPKEVDMMNFCTKAVKEKKVALVPGTAFLINETDECHEFRTNYSTPTDEQLIKGMELLGELVKEI
ncbi:MAG: PLP-dependent aminotransferase family protein [Acutalibacteraceae bacterium]|nr:PLP-dependent aminotransferase family protein [Acutalibacteraceae bacterium]